MAPRPITARRRWLALLAPLALLAACKEPTLHYELRVAGELPAAVLPRASYRGKPLVVQRVGAGRFRAHFETPGDEPVSKHLAELRVGMPTPCGVIEAPFRPAAFPGTSALPRFRQLLADEERIVGRRGQRVELAAFVGDLALPPPLTVIVDWRDAAATTRVMLGELALARGASSSEASQHAERFDIFAPRCAAGRRVRVDGKTVATLAPQVGADATRTVVVVDAAGGHCYRRSARRYAAAATTRPTVPTTAPASPPSPYEALQVLFLRGRRAYLARPAAPSSIEVFPRCPGFLPGRVRCVDLRPHRCRAASSQESTR